MRVVEELHGVVTYPNEINKRDPEMETQWKNIT